jgi:hypothetical protein
MQAIERELKSDLAWLRLKACRLIDSLVLTQDRIAKIKWRLHKKHDYTLPDGITK